MLIDAQTIEDEDEDETEIDEPVRAIKPPMLVLLLTAETVKQSWEILPLICPLQHCGMDKEELAEHWYRQSELQFKLIADWEHPREARYDDWCTALADFYMLARNELDFLSSFQKKLLKTFSDADYDNELHSPIVDALQYVLKAQATIIKRMDMVKESYRKLPYLDNLIKEARVAEDQVTA